MVLSNLVMIKLRSVICIRTRLIPMQLCHAHRFHFVAPRFPFMGRQLAVDPKGRMFVEGERASPHTNAIADQYFRRLSLPARSGQRLSETEALARSTSALCTRRLCLVKNSQLLPGTLIEGGLRKSRRTALQRLFFHTSIYQAGVGDIDVVALMQGQSRRQLIQQC